MRCLILASLAVAAFAGTPANAQNMPWCLVDSLKSGATSCAFTSFEQCRASASAGNIGHCIANPALPDAQPAPHRSGKRSRQ